MPSTVRRHPLAAQAAELLLDRIRTGEWPLGTKLPGENVLGAQLGVGRSTLREAIRELAGKGVLHTRQGAGIFVTALDVAEDWSVVLERASIVSVLEARIAIESEGAALAAMRRSPTDLRALRRALAERSRDGQTAAAFVDADMALHRAIVASSHNAVLTELFDGFIPRVRQAMIDMLGIRSVSHQPNDDQDDHSALVRAIADRDPAAAAELSRVHLYSLVTALQ